MTVVQMDPENPRAVTAAKGMDREQLDLLKRTLATDLTDDEFQLFAQVCTRTGLDPFARQIYAVKRKGKLTLQVGIDGYRLIADRTGKYAGSDDAEYEGDLRCKDQQVPALARVTVWKLVGNLRVAFSASARWAEYYPGDNEGFQWRKMPHLMLGKVAEALALRKAFPAELSGLYTTEEMDQAGDVIDVPPVRHDPPPAVEYITDEQAKDLAERVETVGRALKSYPDEWIERGLPSLAGVGSIAVVDYPDAVAILEKYETELAAPFAAEPTQAEEIAVAERPEDTDIAEEDQLL